MLDRGLRLSSRIRIVVGRAILWFTEAAMNERMARNLGYEYHGPYRPEGILGIRTWAK
jgi:hypothetical protein